MRDESTKQAVQEYLAAKLNEEEQIYEEKHNLATGLARAPWFGRWLRKLFSRSAASGMR